MRCKKCKLSPNNDVHVLQPYRSNRHYGYHEYVDDSEDVVEPMIEDELYDALDKLYKATKHLYGHSYETSDEYYYNWCVYCDKSVPVAEKCSRCPASPYLEALDSATVVLRRRNDGR